MITVVMKDKSVTISGHAGFAEYGKDIVFWGGGINTQKTLPFGTTKQVYDEAFECCRIFGQDGGYVFNSIHNIQAKVPPENVVAMFNAVRDYNNG